MIAATSGAISLWRKRKRIRIGPTGDARHHMGEAIDEPRQHGRIAEFDQMSGRTRRFQDSGRRTNLLDAVALDPDSRALDVRAAADVEHSCCAIDRWPIGRRRRCLVGERHAGATRNPGLAATRQAIDENGALAHGSNDGAAAIESGLYLRGLEKLADFDKLSAI